LSTTNFMYALAVVAESDLVCALPRHFAARHGPRFGIVVLEAPLPLPRFDLSLVLPQVALSDAGIAWLVEQMLEAGGSIVATGQRVGNAPARRGSTRRV
jgi:DNA-binding transcriptional LysR family regulator